MSIAATLSGRREENERKALSQASDPSVFDLVGLKTWGSVQDAQKYNLSLRHASSMYPLNASKVEKHHALSPVPSPKSAPDAFMPLLAPSPLAPLGNSTLPILSGICMLNFSAAENMVEMTAVDCWGIFAPFLANVICCPQIQATLTVLIGESSKTSGLLALDMNQAKYCLSDVQKILTSQGANENLQQICSIWPSNLTEGSCPIKDINAFESTVDLSKLLAACKEVDAVKECCSQVCQSAVSEAARRIALMGSSLSNPIKESSLPEQSTAIDDCRRVVYRWLATKLDPDGAKKVLRRISNCNVNDVCPLVLPTTRNVSRDCSGTVRNQTACCKTLANYISHLQKQSFITNLQALNCAALLGMQLQKANVTNNIYDLCHITLKDFSLQESGCLLPSLPSDAALDSTSGISFTCDLNDIIAAPWPSASLGSTASCNKFRCSDLSRHGKKARTSLLFASFITLAAL
ncbi:putative GPI-anchored protein [Nymphaea thermarum]|nr:putative GPI-anchored protein [Nymphaea thermarum]